MLALLVPLDLLEVVIGVINPDGSAQAIGQMSVQYVNQVSRCISKINAIVKDPSSISLAAVRQFGYDK